MPVTACPNRQVLQDLLEGRISPDAEAAVAAHVEQCIACRTAMESLATGERSAKPLVQQFRGERVELGPAMRGVLDSLGTRHSEPSRVPTGGPGQQAWRPDAALPFLDPPDSLDCIGRLGRYRVLKLLGRGGMGVVFQARDPVLGRLVAVKVLTPQLGDDATARERFLREARSAAAISHANVVTIYSVEEVNRLLLLVMEFVDGVSLHDRLRRRIPFSLPEIVRIAAQTAAGLAAAHARGLVHRDVKPANILLARPADQVKIADFGLARATDDAGVTLPGSIMGTPAYMAPEQALGRALDHRADLFSLGSVLYALCTGQSPYSGSTTLAVIRQVADGKPASLSANSSSIPPWLVDVVTKLHAVDPADRFQSAAEVGQVFRRQWKALQGGGPVAVTEQAEKGLPAVSGGPAGHPVLRVAAAVAVSTGTAAEKAGSEARPAGKAAAAVVTSPTVAAGLTLMPLPAPNHEVIPPPVLRSQTPPPPPAPPAPRPPVLSQARKSGVRLVPPVRGWSRRDRIKAAALGVLLLLLPILLYGIVGHQVPMVGGSSSRQESASGSDREIDGKEATYVAPAPVTRPLRFAILAQDGVTRQTYPDWAAAISAAASGDTLEINGSDPIRIAPLDLHGKALAIRAASGTRPTLVVSRLNQLTEAPLIQSEASLVIEGLDIQCGPAEANAFLPPSLLLVRRARCGWRTAVSSIAATGRPYGSKTLRPVRCETVYCTVPRARASIVSVAGCSTCSSTIACSQASRASPCIKWGKRPRPSSNCVTTRWFSMRRSAYTSLRRFAARPRETGGPSSISPLRETCSIRTRPC